MPVMNESFRILKKAIFQPRVFLRNLNSVYHTRLLRHDYNKTGINIFDEDWDNLILLDACRYDMFKNAIDIDGQLETRTSRGSNTLEFIRGNFKDRILHDTIYITANPMMYRYQEELNAEFYHVENVWKNEGWDKYSNTVLPETVTNITKRINQNYPNKRLLIHYLQPHFPFIDNDTDFDKRIPDPDSPTNMWMEIMTGEIEVQKEILWKGYINNLRCVLESMYKLIPKLEGRTIVTSDHGNMLGERSFPFPIQEWGHPPMTYTNELVEIPWFIINNKTRKEIISEPPKEICNGKQERSVHEKLEALGYV